MADDRLQRTPGDRAERAFARAFSERAHAHTIDPLDPDALARRARLEAAPPARRRPWPTLVAAVVVLVLAVPLVGTWLARPGAVPTAGAPALAPAGQEDRGGGAMSGAAPEAAPVPPIGDASAAGGSTHAWPTPPGRRWESMLDVAVLVPDAWGHGFAPKGDWCAEPGYRPPGGPFVDRNPPGQAVRSILCTEPLPDALRQSHLTWRPAVPGDSDGVEGFETWVRVSRVVGSALLTVEVPAADEATAQEILGSARVVERDPRGCLAAAGGGVAGIDQGSASGPVADLVPVRTVAVCQYADLPGDGPNLVGSYELTGPAAQSVRDAFTAPVVLADPLPICGPTREELVLIFDGGAAEARLPLDGCRTPVFHDGHALYMPVRASCADLLVGPLWKASYADRSIAQVCGP